MPNVRQMAGIYLRGALANVTMRQLTPTQQTHINTLLNQIREHPEIQKHRAKFMKKLGVTIAADYSDDRAAADAEYNIAIWRALADLFYHYNYTYKCQACNSTTYLTKRGRPKIIDRVTEVCPNCGRVEIEDPGCATTLVKGQLLTAQEFQDSYRDLPDGYQAPTSCSTIIPIKGAKKYDNPDEIIADDRQLRKFLGEYIWNYFRQQIKENKRKERKEVHFLTGNTDYLLVQEFLSLCTAMDIKHSYCAKTEPRNGRYTIGLFGRETSPEFTTEFARFYHKAALYGVPVVVTPQTVEILVQPDAIPLPTQYRTIRSHKNGRSVKVVVAYQALVIKPEHVSVMDSLARVSDEQESDSALSQIPYRTVGASRMDQEDHVGAVASAEAMDTIREALPDGHCRDVFDICSQQGDVYGRFSDTYGNGEAKINHVADFLGITTRTVHSYKTIIKHHCYDKGVVPTAR